MSQAYSLDLRDRVVACVLGGRSCSEAAALFSVSKSSAIKWTRRKRETGSAAASQVGGKRPRLLEGQGGWLLARMAEKPDLTVQALLDELHQRGGTVVCHDTLWRFLKRAGLSFKKNRSAKRAGPA